MQYTVGLASNVPNVFIAAGLSNVTATDFPQALLDTFNLLLNDTTPLQTISVSYGSDESTVGPAMAKYVYFIQICKHNSLGVLVLFVMPLCSLVLEDLLFYSPLVMVMQPYLTMKWF